MKLKAILITIIVMFSVLGIPAVSAEIYTSDDDYLRDWDFVAGDWVRISGRDKGSEPGMFFQSDSYAVVGENGEYVFALVYERNKGDKEKSLDFPVTGLYTNDEENKLIYSLPEMECEGFAEISPDGYDVWLVSDEASGDADNMSSVLMSHYVNGELTSEVKMSDLFSSKYELLETESGHYWRSVVYSDNQEFLIENQEHHIIFASVNRNTGEVTRKITPEMLIAPVIMIFFGVIVLLARYCPARKAKALSAD